MTGETFGDRLASARLKRGLSIEQVSEVLRIRSSIIEALETSSFTRMPLKGYSRNMVSSYARFVGLNSTELTEQFLREYHEFEKLPARTLSPVQDNSNRQNGTVIRRGSNGINGSGDAEGEQEREVINLSQRHKASRSYWTSDDPATLNRQARTNPYLPADKKRASKRRNAVRNASIRNQQYSSRRSRGNVVQRHPILFIMILVLILLAILIGWALLANRCTTGNDETIPVVGASADSPEQGVDNAEVDESVQKAAEKAEDDDKYGEFDLTVSVPKKASWLVIKIDGKTVVEDVVNGPWEETYKVSVAASVESGAPGNVKVSRNGREVKLKNKNGLGVLELEVVDKPIPPAPSSTDATVPNVQDENPGTG